MILRITKFLLVAAVAFYYTVVALNNLSDYDSNYQFVRHVLMMDSTFPENHLMWRAINSPGVHTAFYLSVIGWEIATTVLLWMGAVKLAQAARRGATEFEAAKNWAIGGLALGMLMWLVAFLSVGGEWFLMWQSKSWNGQEEAFRMFCVVGVVMLLVVQRDDKIQSLAADTNSR